jgi:hypothetical protein
MHPHQDFAWFAAVEAPFGKTWWSHRHDCFATIVQDPFSGAGAIGRGPPGPRTLAWSTAPPEWVAFEHVVGPTLADLLGQVSVEDLHLDVRRRVVGHLALYKMSFVTEGWPFPSDDQIRLGFSGQISVEVHCRRQLRRQSREDDDFDSAYESRQQSYRQGLDAMGVHLGLTDPKGRDEWHRLDAPIAALVADVFAEDHAAWREACRISRQRPPREQEPPAPWNDVEQERLSFEGDGAVRLLNDLMAGRSEARQAIAQVRHAPLAVARLRHMREKPMADWTWTELEAWSGVRHHRRLALWRQRGLLKETDAMLRGDASCERLIFEGTDFRTRSAPFSGCSPLDDKRIAHLLGRACLQPDKTPLSDEVIAAERAELQVRLLFGIDAWCEATMTTASASEVRAAWREAWLGVDDELGPECVARCATLHPRLPDVGQATMEAAMRHHDELNAKAEAKLAEAAAEATRVAALPIIKVELRGRETPPQTLLVQKAMFELGRDPTCDVVLSRHGVSRRHARVTVNDRILWLQNLSLVGTWVDGQRITAAPVRVTADSVIMIGGHTITMSIKD